MSIPTGRWDGFFASHPDEMFGPPNISYGRYPAPFSFSGSHAQLGGGGIASAAPTAANPGFNGATAQTSPAENYAGFLAAPGDPNIAGGQSGDAQFVTFPGYGGSAGSFGLPQQGVASGPQSGSGGSFGNWLQNLFGSSGSGTGEANGGGDFIGTGDISPSSSTGGFFSNLFGGSSSSMSNQLEPMYNPAPTNGQLGQAALNLASYLPVVGPFASLANLIHGGITGFNNVTGDPSATTPSPSVLGNDALGSKLYGNTGMAGSVGNLFGSLGGQLSSFFGITTPPDPTPPDVSGILNDLYGTSTASTAPADPNQLEPMNSPAPNPNIPGMQSATAAYSLPGTYNLSGQYIPPNPASLDPNNPVDNAIMSAMTLNQVGGSGTSQPTPPAIDPFGPGVADMMNTFMQGAGFGGAGYGYGSNDPIFSPSSWAAPGFGAVDRGMNPNDTN